MNKLAKFAMLASALLIPHVASAAPVDGTYRGQVTVKKGLTLSCTLTAVVSGGGTLTSLTLSGSSLCSSVTFSGQPYATTSTATTYTISGIVVNTITSGNCAGSASGTYTGTTINVNAVLPPVSGGGNCSISGTLTKL